MKTKAKKVFSRIIVLLLAVLVAVNIPISALAESIPVDTEIIADDNASPVMPVVHENGGYSIGSYTYTPPKAGKFWIRDVEGTLIITDGIPVIAFADFTVTVPAFDWYKVLTQSDDRYTYRADVLKDLENTNNFVYAEIRTPISFMQDSAYELYLQYFVEAENRMYNIRAILTEPQFLFFEQQSALHTMEADEVSQRLRLSASIYTEGTFENRGENAGSAAYGMTAGNTASPAALNPIPANNYDDYTDSDGIIRDYAEEYLIDNRGPGDPQEDDPIIDIVPKELCLIPGEHLYVGKEYGFFIRVENHISSFDIFAVHIMVFDIIHTTPGFMGAPGSETGSAKIEPLFQYTYKLITQEDDFQSPFPPTRFVVFDKDAYKTYYRLADVGFRFTLDNPTALNEGDVGYDPYEDEGAFIIASDLSAEGVGLNKADASFAHDTALFAFGFVPYVGTVLSTLDFAYSILENVGDENAGEETFDWIGGEPEAVYDGSVSAGVNRTNSTDQINYYGHLKKSQAVALNPDAEDPFLIPEGGHITAEYTIARKSGSDYDKIRVTTSISLSVVEDNTGTVINYGSSTGTYETSGYTRLNNAMFDGEAQVTVPENTQTNIIKFIPAVSGSYLIRTQSTQGDPNFRITNATTGAQAVSATDDISTTNKNAKLTINLVKNNVYCIEAFRYGTPHDFILKIGYAPTATQILEEDVPYSVTTADGTMEMLAFTPSSSGLYWLSATDTDDDVQMFTLYSSGGLVDINAYTTYPYLQQEYYLDSGETYYVVVQGEGGEAVSTTVLISTMYY